MGARVCYDSRGQGFCQQFLLFLEDLPQKAVVPLVIPAAVKVSAFKVRGLDLSSCWMSFNVFRFPVSFFVWDCKDTVRCWRTGQKS